MATDYDVSPENEENRMRTFLLEPKYLHSFILKRPPIFSPVSQELDNFWNSRGEKCQTNGQEKNLESSSQCGDA